MPAAASGQISDGGPATTPVATSATRRSAVKVTLYADVVACLSERNLDELERILRNASRVGDATKLSILLEKRAEIPFNVDARDPKTGNTALILASESGHAKVVQLLTKFAADVTVANDDGHTAVELAANSTVREVLLDSVGKGEPQRNLCQAAWQGDAMLLRRILSQSSVDVNCHNSDGLTPLMLAARDVEYFEPLSNAIKYAYRPVGVVCELLAQSGDVRAIDGEKKTALHYICTSRSKLAAKVVECLLKAGADHSGRDRSWRTPLHYAAAAGNVDVVSQLLDAGADPSARDSSGQTPLHCTSRGDHEQATSVLLRRGADVSLVDELGKTAVDYARSKRILAMFRQCMPPLDPADPFTDGFPSLKAQSFGKVHVTSSADQQTSRSAEQNVVVVSRVSSAAMASSGDARRSSDLERSKSQEREDDVDKAQRGMTARPAGTQTPPAIVSTSMDNEGSPRQLSMSGAIYSRHLLSSSAQSVSVSEQSSTVSLGLSHSASLGSRLASTSQTRVNQKGMASMPTRRSPVNMRRTPVKIIVPTIQTTPQIDPKETALGSNDTSANSVNVTTPCEPSTTPKSNESTRSNDAQHHVISSNQSCLAVKQNVKLKFHELINFGDPVKCGEQQQQQQQQGCQDEPVRPTPSSDLIASCLDVISPKPSSFACSFKSILRSGAFNIEETRVRKSDDSGVVADACGSSGSGTDSTSSSCSSSLSVNHHGPSATSTTQDTAVPTAASGSTADEVGSNDKVPDVHNPNRLKTLNVKSQNQATVADAPAKESVTAVVAAVNRLPQTTTAVVTVIRPKLDADVRSSLKNEALPRDGAPATRTRPAMNRSTSVSSKLGEGAANTTRSDKQSDENRRPANGNQSVRKIDSSPSISSIVDSENSSNSRRDSNPSASPSAAVAEKSKVVTRSNIVDVESATVDPTAVDARSTPSRVSVPNIKQIEVVDARSVARISKPVQQPVDGASIVRTRTNVELDARKVSISSRSKTVVGSMDDQGVAASQNAAVAGKQTVVSRADSSVPLSGIGAWSDIGVKQTSASDSVGVVVSPKVDKPTNVASIARRRNLPPTARSTPEDSSTKPNTESETDTRPACDRGSPREAGVMKPVTSDSLPQNQRPAVVVTQQPKPFGVVGRGATIIHGVACGGPGGWTAAGSTTATNSPRTVRGDGHNGPVICDAFESVRRQQLKQAAAEAASAQQDAAGTVHPFSVPVTPCFGKTPPSSIRPLARPKTGMGGAVPRGVSEAAPTAAAAAYAATAAARTRPSRSRPTTARNQCGSRRKKKSHTPRTSSPASVANSSVVVRVKPSPAKQQQMSACVGTRRTDGRRSRKKDKRPSSRRKAEEPDDGVGTDADDVALGAAAPTPGVTLIGGIGWQIATRCDDMTDVRAVKKFAEDKRTIGVTPRRPKRASKETAATRTTKRKTTKCATSSAASRTESPTFKLISPITSDDDDEESCDNVFEMADIPEDSKLPPTAPVRRSQSDTSHALASDVVSNSQLPEDIQNATAVPSRLEQHVVSPHADSAVKRNVQSELISVVVESVNCVALDASGRSDKTSILSTRPSSTSSAAVDAVGRVVQLSRNSETGLPDDVSPSSLDTFNDDNLDGSTSYQRRRKSRMKAVVDAEIDAAIDEIMHTSYSSLSSTNQSDGRRKSMTPRQPHHPLKPQDRSPADDVTSADANVATDVDGRKAELPVDNDPDDGVARLIRAYRTMPLRATGGKPPVSSRRSNVVTLSISVEEPKLETQRSVVVEAADGDLAAAVELRLARSPRFVRKHDSVPSTPGEHGRRRHRHDHHRQVPHHHGDSLASSVDLMETIMNLDDMIPDDSLSSIVTSRLGRSGRVCSRADSFVSDTLSAASDEVETIQWKRGNVLGKGAYGTVWCGLTNTGELIAVKMIELNTADMEKAEREYEQIQEEVGILKTLKHRNIVGYLGTCLEDMVVSIFMQFVPGGSIANILARFGALEEEVFCSYTRQTLEGVEYLHHNDVIHRDIKGGNIMLMPDGVIKLIDFGCAKKLCFNLTNGKPSDILRSMRGTPYWMAPEVVKEEGHGTKSDIWSIGCTVFEMATKKPPWSDMAPSTAIFSIGSASQPIPSLPADKFSSLSRSFVTACLTRNPDDRPSATDLLKHPFVAPRRRTAVRTSRRS